MTPRHFNRPLWIATLALTQLVIEQKRGPEPSYHFGPELLRRWLQQQGHIRALR